jgi:thiol:disulfide interchange protein DsbA
MIANTCNGRTSVYKSLVFLGAAIMLAGLSFVVRAADYAEGFEYKLVTPPVATSSGDTIEVVELFWYGCPHCYNFEPALEKWRKTKPDNVKFVRIPAVLRKSWELHARAFYIAETLGMQDAIHHALFDAMHKQSKTINTPAALKTFFMQQGVKESDYDKAFNSFTVQSKVQRAVALGERYEAHGVPTMIVNGKYRTNTKMASLGEVPHHDNMLKVVDHLIKLESAAAGKK